MTVHRPNKRLMHAIPLKFVQKRVSGGGHRSVSAELSLTSMIDFLVVTVVFLLMSFSASGETTIPKGVNLPSAENADAVIDAPLVAVAGRQLLLDGKPSGNTQAVDDSKKVQKIDELFNTLRARRENWTQINPGKDFPGVVILQIDRDVPAVVVKSVFQTSALAGYPTISFMVNKAAKTSSSI